MKQKGQSPLLLFHIEGFGKVFDKVGNMRAKYNGIGGFISSLPVEKRDDNEYEAEFKNVSFKYPGTEEYILKNICMKLNIWERLTIVSPWPKCGSRCRF